MSEEKKGGNKEINDADADAPLSTFFRVVGDALKTGFGSEHWERELYFTVPAAVPLLQFLELLDVENADKKLGALRVTVSGQDLWIRQLTPSLPHEIAANLASTIHGQIQFGLAGLVNDPELDLVGAARFMSGNVTKEGDAAFLPASRADAGPPSVVIEVGDSQSRPSLKRAVDHWFQMNQNGAHRVNLVITVRLWRKTVTLPTRVVVTFFERATVPNTDLPILGSPVFNLGPSEWTVNDLLPANVGTSSIPALNFPTHYFYDTLPAFLLPHPVITIPRELVLYWLEGVFRRMS